jgi:broad specificity phosphatase PhoE
MVTDSMQTIWLARHAHRLDFVQPEWFETALHPYDPPLSPEGVEMSISLARTLSREPIDLIFSSPFLRTVQTADPIARILELPIRVEWGLCEWLCQDWTTALPETLAIDKLKLDYPNIDLAYSSLVLPCYPETHEELDARLLTIANKLVQSNSQNILAIAHKGSVLGIIAILTGNAEWRNYNLLCGEIIKLVRVEGEWFSEIVNR